MKLVAALRGFASTILHRAQANGEMDEELSSHIALRADDLERSGLSRAEAERRARIEFGGYHRFKQECHEERRGHFIETLMQDVRFGLRMMGRSPGFTVVAALTLAFAIGANAVVFSMMNGLVLQPLNLPHGKDLYAIERDKDNSPIHSYPDYLDLRDRNRSFDGIVAYDIYPAGLNTGSKAYTSWLFEASGNYFDVLGVQPYLGRFFHPSDEHGPNSASYIVLSYAYWHSHFQGDRNVISRVVQVNKHPYTVIGVAPRDFRGTELFFAPDFWIPIVNKDQIEGGTQLYSRRNRGIEVLGRLKPGVTPAQAITDLNSVAAYLTKAYASEDDQISFSLAKPGLAGDMLGRPVRAFVTGLMLLAALILLAACANLGSLFAARASDRCKEIALRLALGSSRKRIVRQLMTEAIMVSLIGGAVGLLGSIALLHWLSTWQPTTSFPVRLPLETDANVYLVALLLALASGLLFGMVPVRQVMLANPYQIVKGDRASARARWITPRDILLVVQITVCAVLVTSSLVAVRGLVRSLHSNFGFVSQNRVVVDTDLSMAGYSGDQVSSMQKRMVDAIEVIPGVTAAGMVDRPPLTLGWSSSIVFQDTTTDFKTSNAAAEAIMYKVSPGYLHAAGTTLLAGRSFTLRDDKNAPRVAIVNREFARQVFKSEAGAVGRYYKMPDGTRIQVTGLVEDGKYRSLAEDPQPAMFFPMLQSPTGASWLVVHSSRDPQQLASVIDSTLRNLDSGLPFGIRTWDKELINALFPSRVATISLGVLGVLGAMLAMTGIFGMAAYSVSRRLREFGIRIALGARRKEVLNAALGRAFRLLAFGSFAGLLFGLAATKVLSFIVYEATPRDPLVLIGALTTMLLLGLIATWLPAMRALQADPIILLREE
jgi:predicted permease